MKLITSCTTLMGSPIPFENCKWSKGVAFAMRPHVIGGGVSVLFQAATCLTGQQGVIAGGVAISLSLCGACVAQSYNDVIEKRIHLIMDLEKSGKTYCIETKPNKTERKKGNSIKCKLMADVCIMAQSKLCRIGAFYLASALVAQSLTISDPFFIKKIGTATCFSPFLLNGVACLFSSKKVKKDEFIVKEQKPKKVEEKVSLATPASCSI